MKYNLVQLDQIIKQKANNIVSVQVSCVIWAGYRMKHYDYQTAKFF